MSAFNLVLSPTPSNRQQQRLKNVSLAAYRTKKRGSKHSELNNAMEGIKIAGCLG